jgi:hypothetical protein
MQKLLLFAALLVAAAEGLRFGHDPVTVDTGVLVVGQPSRLTCNYVKYRTEARRGMRLTAILRIDI